MLGLRECRRGSNVRHKIFRVGNLLDLGECWNGSIVDNVTFLGVPGGSSIVFLQGRLRRRSCSEEYSPYAFAVLTRSVS